MQLTSLNIRGGKTRQSNFELLRIVAMLLVLVVHADFFSIGIPGTQDIQTHPVSSAMRFVTQSLALVCVNLFIFISGYFRIRLKKRSILNFLFMVLFWRAIVIALYMAAPALWPVEPNFSRFGLIKMIVPGYDDWFVESYIILMFLSPIINSYLDSQSPGHIWRFAIAYCAFQFTASWALETYPQFIHGYSALSFIGLYVLGAAVRAKAPLPKGHAVKCLGSYLALSVFAAIAAMFAIRHVGSTTPAGNIVDRMFGAYNGVPIVAASLALFLFFKQLSFSSRIINTIAASAFAVYLFHMHPLVRPVYAYVCQTLFNNYGTWEYLAMVSLFIISVFAVSILVDFIRRWLWSLLAPKCEMLLTRFSPAQSNRKESRAAD